MDIGKRIKEIRNELKVTTSKMAEQLDIPARTIGSYERNEALPGVKFLYSINEQYNVNLNWLITGKGDKFINNQSDDKHFVILSEIAENPDAVDMIKKFIEIKKGNRQALEELIQNLKGIKAVME